jgi:membrane protease YdiL (CAAX protease family)
LNAYGRGREALRSRNCALGRDPPVLGPANPRRLGRTDFLSGAWGWFALILLLQIFNTVLGEELLFRGLLLPRMNCAFGRWDWVANGVLFAAYHLHVPCVIPVALLDTFILAYPTKRYRSAWIGIALHSAQSVVIAILVFTLVV